MAPGVSPGNEIPEWTKAPEGRQTFPVGLQAGRRGSDSFAPLGLVSFSFFSHGLPPQHADSGVLGTPACAVGQILSPLPGLPPPQRMMNNPGAGLGYAKLAPCQIETLPKAKTATVPRLLHARLLKMGCGNG